MEKFKKLYRPTLFKAILIIVMAWNTGPLQLYLEQFKDDPRSAKEVVDLRQKVENFAEEKYERAKQGVAQGIAYSPGDYFRDMTEIETYRKELKAPSGVLQGSLRLQVMLEGNRSKGIFSYVEVVRARQRYESAIHASPHDKFGLSEVKTILTWLFEIYLLNLLPVALFYLILLIERWKSQDRSLSILSLIYFVWKVFAHPFYLTRSFVRWWRSGYREFYFEAEYRRTKSKLFVYLTEREKRRIKNFAENGLPIQVWRGMLKLKGLRPVHSLATVLVVMLVIAILPKATEAKIKKTGDTSSGSSISWEKSSHLPRADIDDEVSGPEDFWDTEEDILPKGAINFRHFPKILKRFALPEHFCFLEVWHKILHIPLSMLFSFVFGFTYELNTAK